MRKKRKMVDCVEYLSVDAPLDRVERLEDKQQKYIREYVRNKEYRIVGTIRRHGFSMNDVNRQWKQIACMIRKKQVQGVVIANMAAVSMDLPDAYAKVGQIVAAGGIVVTVDEGPLRMGIKGWLYE